MRETGRPLHQSLLVKSFGIEKATNELYKTMFSKGKSHGILKWQE